MTRHWLADNVAEPVSKSIDGLSQGVKDKFYASRLYQASLKGRHPNHLLVYPQDPFGGTAALADEFYDGRFTFAGVTIEAQSAPPWSQPGVTLAWLEEWHSFDWIRHIAAAGGDMAKRHARGFVKSWLQNFARYDPVGWRPDILARRQMAWLYHAKLILDPSDLVYRSVVMNTLARQARHLLRVGPSAPKGMPRLEAAVGLVFSSLCLPYSNRRYEAGIEFLKRELNAQVLGDGGFISRNPQDQVRVLRLLGALRKLFLTADKEVPSALQLAIDRLAPMTRALMHGDGGLALFHGSNEGDHDAIKAALALSESTAKPISDARHSGYQRVSAGTTLLIIDAGMPPARDPRSAAAHASPLAFEMSVGGQRLVVNCGHGEAGTPMEDACRATAAHSTLVLGERNACQLLPGGKLGRVPSQVTCERQESDGQTWLTLLHDGYRKLFGVDHERRLYLSADGNDLRGEDSLVGPGLDKHEGLAFTLRFHLHPTVPASLLSSGDSVVFRIGRSEAWRFSAKGGTVTLEESIYLGGGHPRKCEQIVVTSAIGQGKTRVKWSFKRLEAIKGGAKDISQAGGDTPHG